tara:strand:+ start:298 stop:2199 length:1902 start_codon:yes stop_codon:yes gene_type:complete
MINRLFLFLVIFSISYADLLNPEGNLRTVHVLFEWEQEPDAVSYNLRIYDSNNSIIQDIEEPTTIYIEKNLLNWDTDYYWQVRPIYPDETTGDWIGTQFFDIGEKILPNLEVNLYNENLIDDDLIIYTQFSPYVATGVIDKYGNEIWNTDFLFMNHVNEFGQMYGNIGDPGVRFNFNHEILWSTPPGYIIDGHEVKQTSTGNYMAFVPSYEIGPIPNGDWTNYFQFIGYQADGVTNEFPWMGLRMVEFDQDTREEVWNWNPFEHFSMEDSDLYGGFWWQAAFSGTFDWMHSNAFHFDEDESVIYVSHRHLSRITKLDYPSGEVIWNMGLPAEYSTGEDNICTDLLFSFQHHIQLMDDGSLLFFDNGNISTLFGDTNPTTRIRNVRVIDDSYCETLWQYDLPQNLHGAGMGSVQLLDNGNYSIYTYGNGLNDPECSILEITADGDMVWKVTSENPNSAWYRSYKIPSIYPDAFSVIVDNYTSTENNIEIENNTLTLTLYNKSGYTQVYKYLLSDLLDGGIGMFDYDEGQIELGPNDSYELSFDVSNLEIDYSMINFSVWPIYHDYALKELFFDVQNDSQILGDLNVDGLVNILDVVMLVNVILQGESNLFADINFDGEINVIDIVQLVSIILET